ncbi:MAG: pantetheine-phosphate adenylyltransferase [Planctomycetes bacterium]|nr:pantetheine-phosphate adenylyltransferase [Planctomycetota bacterium]
MAKTRQHRIAVFPGQFDPITKGHLDVIHRGVQLFDELIVAVGINPDKKELFNHDERVEMIRYLLRDEPRAHVQKYAGLTVDFVKKAGASVILRGIRDVSDLRYEFQLAMANRAVGGIETVFIMTGEHFALTSSSLIRQVVALGGDLRQLKSILPEIVIRKLRAEQKTQPPTTDIASVAFTDASLDQPTWVLQRVGRHASQQKSYHILS